MTAWRKCPTCRADMWVGHVDAPQRVIHGCAHCNTKTQVSPVVDVELAQLVLFEEAS